MAGGAVIFSGASSLNTYKFVWGCSSAVRELLVSISVCSVESSNTRRLIGQPSEDSP